MMTVTGSLWIHSKENRVWLGILLLCKLDHTEKLSLHMSFVSFINAGQHRVTTYSARIHILESLTELASLPPKSPDALPYKLFLRAPPKGSPPTGSFSRLFRD